MAKSKKQLAQEFIARLQSIQPAELNRLVVSQAGNELVDFFYAYAQSVARQQQGKSLDQLVSSILMVGYLIRTNEEQVNTLGNLPTPAA